MRTAPAGYTAGTATREVKMGSSIVRGLIAGAVLLAVAGSVGMTGVLDLSDAAAAGTILTLFLLCALALFDTECEPADTADATGEVPLMPEALPDAGSHAA